MKGWLRWGLGLVTVVAGNALAAPPVLTGLYQFGNAGLIDFSISDGQVVGRYKMDGVCQFTPGTEVISGYFEGTTFIGNVHLCQSGSACDEAKTYPFLGIWSDGKVSGAVHLDVGCSSSALENKVLRIRAATGDQKQRVLNPPVKEFKTEAEAIEARMAAMQMINSVGDFARAKDLLLGVLARTPDDWRARAGVGAAQIALKQFSAAAETLQVARLAAARSKSKENPDRFREDYFALVYNSACAQAELKNAPEAVAFLRESLKYSDVGTMVDQTASDHSLDEVRSSVEFKRFVDELRKGKRK